MMAFSVSETGVLAYGVGSGAAVGLRMVWVDKQGKVVEVVGAEGNYRGSTSRRTASGSPRIGTTGKAAMSGSPTCQEGRRRASPSTLHRRMRPRSGRPMAVPSSSARFKTESGACTGSLQMEPALRSASWSLTCRFFPRAGLPMDSLLSMWKLIPRREAICGCFPCQEIGRPSRC